VALLQKIGPSILLAHSQVGTFGWPVADARRTSSRRSWSSSRTVRLSIPWISSAASS